MAKRKRDSTPSLSKKGKKTKTSARSKNFDKKNYQVRVILPSSPKSQDKPFKTPSTSTAGKGDSSVKKSVLAKRRAAAIFGASKQEEKVISSSPKISKDQFKSKSHSQNDNLQFWQEKGILLEELEDKRFGNYLWSWFMKKLVAQPKKVNATLVEEFYNKAPEELDTPFDIRGQQVDILAEAICSYYDIMEANHQGDRGMDASELTVEDLRSLRRFQHPT